MTRAGRVVHVQFVLIAMMIYLAMAMDLPPWAIKVIDNCFCDHARPLGHVFH
jgi:hypothetical protein